MESKKERVLIVDDNEINRQVLKKILSDSYEILEADNGLAALNLLDLESSSVSAVLLDIIMPVMDGFHFLEELKNKSYRELPIIIMTGSKDADTEEKALRAGACDFVTKPFQPIILLSRLENAIARSQIRYLKRIQYAAEHDALTDLYTQHHFFQRSQTLFLTSISQEFVMVCLEIDRFPVLRSMWGEAESERFLKYAADLIRHSMALYRSSRYCRSGTSGFCFFTEYNEEKLRMTINTLIEGFAAYDRNYQIEPSIGIYRTDNHSIPIEKMYLNASIAMQNCVNQYHVYTCEYSPSMGESLIREQNIINEMDAALSSGQFIIYLQPKYNLQTNTPYGAEALVRWKHPEKGMISPGVFIPVFEKNGFIGKLDLYVWETVCALLRKWIDEGLAPAPVSVNMSRADLYNPNLIETICGLIRKYRLKPELLNLEITESTYMDNPKLMSERIQELRKLGFCIMMDDFGSAYSSLNMLKDIQVDYLKIDMKFLQGEAHSTRSERVMASIIRMAGWLDLPVIVEGVETKEQYEFLQSIGCGYIQGYFFSPPIPVEDYEHLINGIQQTAYIYRSDIKEAANIIWSSSPELNYLIDALPLPMAIYEYDEKDFSILRMNSAFKSAFGYQGNSADTSIIFQKYLNPENQQRFLDTTREAIRIRGIASCDYQRTNNMGDSDNYRLSLRYLGMTDTSYILIAAFVRIDSVATAEKTLSSPSLLLKGLSMDKDEETITLKSLKEAINFMGSFSDTVRIVDPMDCATVTFTDAGEILRKRKNCFLVWGRSERCQNCTSRYAIETNRRQIKYEMFGNQTFLVTSAPVAVTIDSQNYRFVIEIVNRVAADKLTDEQRKKYMSTSADDSIYHDKLTGVFNRSYLNRILMIELGTSIRCSAMSAMMLNINNFKKINQRYGRLTGNLVLEQTASCLREHLRSEDRIIRMTGDDFLILLIGCDKANALEKAGEIKNAAALIPYSIRDQAFIVLDIGISSRDSFDMSSDTVRTMIQEALVEMNQIQS